VDLNTQGMVKSEINEIKSFLNFNVSQDSIFLSKNKVDMFDGIIEAAKASPYISDEEVELVIKEKEKMEEYHNELFQTRKDKESVMLTYRKLIGDVSPEELEVIRKVEDIKPIKKKVEIKKEEKKKVDKKVEKNLDDEELDDEINRELEKLEEEETDEKIEE